MSVLASLSSEFETRWAIVRNPESTRSQRIFALLEIFCFPVSMMAILLLFVQLILFLCRCGAFIPNWWLRYVSPILLAGAVGYLTNWLAIMMLFRPYDPVKWLVIWPQGMIPRNKSAVAQKMGDEVGNKLLSPEQLADEITGKLVLFLSDPAVIKKIRMKIQEFLLLYQKTIVEFLIPKIEKTLVDEIDKLITPDNLKDFWEKELRARLDSEETRNQIAEYVVKVGQDNASSLTAAIQDQLHAYLVQKLVFIPQFIRNQVVQLVISFFADRASMQTMVKNWLAAPETQKMICDKMINIGVKMNEWIQSPEAKAKLGCFSDDAKKSLKEFLKNYLHTALPAFAQNALDSPELWQWFETEMLPGARDGLVDFVNGHKQQIIDNLKLAQRIEDAINAQDVRNFHTMINNIAAQHLGAIQVLGFLLGVLVGLLQLLQTAVCE